jgi:Arc/MetJ-type ribon-helix-helix transcriptional regulator
MSRQILKSKVKEQVENKVNPILEEKYQEDIAIKLFKSSSEVIRDSIDEVTKSYYLNYPREIKENFIKEVLTQVFEWKNKIQERSKSKNITGLDQLLSRKIIDILKEYLRALKELDIDKRQHELYQVDTLAAVTCYAKVEDLVKSPFSLELCKKNNWIIEIPKNS